MPNFHPAKRVSQSDSRSIANNIGAKGISASPPLQTKRDIQTEAVVQRVLIIDGTPHETITLELEKELAQHSNFIMFMHQFALEFVPFLKSALIQYCEENRKMKLAELTHSISNDFMEYMIQKETDEKNTDSAKNLKLFEEYMPKNFIAEGSLTTGNAIALNSHLEQNPTIFEKVRLHNKQGDLKQIIFNGDENTKAFGGAYYSPDNKNIHSNRALNSSPATKFVQLMMHELGHATFQKYLEGANRIEEVEEYIKDLSMKYAQIKDREQLLSLQSNLQGGVTDLQREDKRSKRGAIIITKGKEFLDSKDPEEEIKEVMAEMRYAYRLLDYYKKGREDGIVMRSCYEILFKNGAQYFFGTEIDKNETFSPEGRKKYQLSINEFFAESFMHISYHEESLISFVKKLQVTEGVPEEVTKAWGIILDVLIGYKAFRVFE